MNLFQRSASVVHEGVEGECYLIPVKNNVANLCEIYRLNKVGYEIFESLREPKSLEGVCQHLMAEFEGDLQSMREDVEAFIFAFSERGWVKVINEVGNDG